MRSSCVCRQHFPGPTCISPRRGCRCGCGCRPASQPTQPSMSAPGGACSCCRPTRPTPPAPVRPLCAYRSGISTSRRLPRASLDSPERSLAACSDGGAARAGRGYPLQVSPTPSSMHFLSACRRPIRPAALILAPLCALGLLAAAPRPTHVTFRAPAGTRPAGPLGSSQFAAVLPSGQLLEPLGQSVRVAAGIGGFAISPRVHSAIVAASDGAVAPFGG